MVDVVAAYVQTMGLAVVTNQGARLLKTAAQSAPVVPVEADEDPMSKEVANRNAQVLKSMFTQMPGGVRRSA